MKILTSTLLLLVISALTMVITVNASEKTLDDEEIVSHHHMGVKHMEGINEHMEAMHAQMQAIHAEKDPEKRRILMQAHRKSMHEGMQMMDNMCGMGRMGMMHRDDNKKAEKGKTNLDKHARMDHLEHRMDMMQKMMDQMMQHEDVKHRHMHSKE